MAGIYHPSRGGVRGGKDQFNWDDVKTDKDRESYLGMLLLLLDVCLCLVIPDTYFLLVHLYFIFLYVVWKIK